MKISIVIPIFNVENYITACIHSVMNQDYTGEIECLLIDDCGTDNSILLAEECISTNRRPNIHFRIIHHQRNRGLSAARNTGIDAATGEYIYYLDSDDEITPDCIEKLVSIAQNFPDVEMIQGNSVMKPNDIRFKNSVDRRLPDLVRSNLEIAKYYQKHWKIVYH